MKTPKRFMIAAALSLCLGFTAQLHAQLLPVIARLTVQQQDFSTYRKGVYTDRVRNSRLGTSDLLDLLACAYGTNFPARSSLVLVNYDHFEVQSPSGAILLTNVSDFLTYSDTYNDTNYLFQGKENTVNESMSYLFTYQATLQFTDSSTNQTSFTFTGLVQERYSQSAPDNFGRRNYRDALVLNGLGSGKRGDHFFTLSGRISTPLAKWTQ